MGVLLERKGGKKRRAAEETEGWPEDGRNKSEGKQSERMDGGEDDKMGE